MPDFVGYVDMDLNALLKRLSRIAYDMANLLVDKHNLLIDERREKARLWEECGGDSVASRDRYAQIHTLSITTELLTVDAEIESRKIEYELIQTIMRERVNLANATSIPLT